MGMSLTFIQLTYKDYYKSFILNNFVPETNTARQKNKTTMKKKILLIDDKESIAKVVSIYLSAEFDLTYFENPIKAIAWLQEGNIPDLIISDIRMPEMRGDEFLHYVKSNALFSLIPVIMLSSEESTSERIRLLEEGADDYILKPFNPMELKIRIKKIIKE